MWLCLRVRDGLSPASCVSFTHKQQNSQLMPKHNIMTTKDRESPKSVFVVFKLIPSKREEKT